MVIEDLYAHVLFKFFDRDSACEAVIGAVEANDLCDQALDESRSLGENGLQNCLLPLEGHDIARITISVGIARDVGDGLAGLAIGGDALGLKGNPDVIVRDNLIAPRQHVDDLGLVACRAPRLPPWVPKRLCRVPRMPVTMSQAKAAVSAAKSLPPGKSRKLSDGRSVALVCNATRAYWVLNYRDPVTGKLRSAGLGSFADTTPQQARIKADALRSGAPAHPGAAGNVVPMLPRPLTPGTRSEDRLPGGTPAAWGLTGPFG
jgi:hypothetical protein